MTRIALDLNFDQVMKMSVVKRWAIVDMSRQQSLAEHSYNVAVIARALLLNMDVKCANVLAQAMSWALDHDTPEVVTGDIPTPLKAMVGDAICGAEKKMFPLWHMTKEMLRIKSPIVLTVVKAADHIDAIQFAERYCIDPNAKRIISEIHERLGAMTFDDYELRRAVEIVWPVQKTR